MDLKKRLGAIIQKDKKTNPQYLIDIIKSDLYYMLNNYFEIDFDNISVQINHENEKYNITILTHGERLKTMKVIPE